VRRDVGCGKKGGGEWIFGGGGRCRKSKATFPLSLLPRPLSFSAPPRPPSAMALDFKKVLQKPLVAVSGPRRARALPTAACPGCVGRTFWTPHTTHTPFPSSLSQSEDMTAEQTSETVEIITAAVDKFLSTENYEVRPSLLSQIGGTRFFVNALSAPRARARAPAASPHPTPHPSPCAPFPSSPPPPSRRRRPRP
jgi:hypothetical protein